MDLRKKDVAELLTVSETTIDSLVEKSGLPCYKIHNEYRFNRSEIEDWMVKVLASEKGSLPFGEEMGQKAPLQQFGLYRAINKGDVIANLDSSSKEELIYLTLDGVSEKLRLNPQAVADLFLERENLMPTALNQGIAIPHTREFLLGGLFDAVVVVYPKVPIEWGALDNKPVHTLFFLFACDDRRHLNLLAKIAHFISSEDHLRFLETKPDQMSLLEFIKTWEASIKAKSISEIIL
ncbi:MAG: helix-turn-helix domain-containing protein [Chlamydiae bacterium]|jgi:PTS system nitrogen regulatory IIA component|nr:helix-turn-helix domain-containing protein [Chlamydiota bacterium]